MAQDNLQRRAIQENRPFPSVRGHQVQKVDMDRTCVQNGLKCHPKGSHEMDTTREEEKRPPERDVEKICREGDERTWMDLGPSAALGRRQTALAFIGEDLIC